MGFVEGGARLVDALSGAIWWKQLTHTLCTRCGGALHYCVQCGTGRNVKGKEVEALYPVLCLRCNSVDHRHNTQKQLDFSNLPHGGV